MSVFNEDTRVKIPATIQFLRIGYDYQSLREADIDFNTKIFVNRFKPALEKINGREFTYDEIKMIINDIHAVIKKKEFGQKLIRLLIDTPYLSCVYHLYMFLVYLVSLFHIG